MRHILNSLLFIVLLMTYFQANARGIYCDVSVIANEEGQQTDDGQEKSDEEEEEEPECD